MSLLNFHNVFISGIGGIGTSALARFFISRGAMVTGSDGVKSEITEALEKRGVKIYYKQEAANVAPDFDLFVYSAAVPPANPERQKAKELKILQKGYFEVLGEVSREFKTIAVSGTNGKSTTTAMIASVLIDAALDPTVIVGSQCSKLDGNFRAGKSDLFVVEACEYRAHMLLLKPRTIVLTNIEEDHLDYYRDLNHIVQTFQQYVSGLKSEDDLLVYNNDDLNIRKLRLPKCRHVKFGLIPGADVCAENIRKLPGKQLFDVIYYGQNIGEFELQVPGTFNIYNALGAIAYCMTLNLPIGAVKKSLREYAGIWRRFEVVKSSDGLTVISDYAHHPTAVEGTLKAAHEFLPGRRIVAVFQPHQKDRTKKLFDDFVKSFTYADVVILPEIFDVAGREEEIKVSSEDLAKAMLAMTPKKQIVYARNMEETLVKIKEVVKNEDVVLIMGAGDVYKIVNKV